MNKLIDADVVTQEMCRALFVNLIHADDEEKVVRAVLASAPAAAPWVRITKETMPPDDADVFIWDGMCAKAGYTAVGKFCYCDNWGNEQVADNATHYMLIEAPAGE